MNRTTRPAARAMTCVALVAALGGARPALAGTYEGTILAPVLHPTVAREMYHRSPALNEITGFVVELNGTVAAGSTYTLKTLGGLPPVEFDAYFYPDIDTGTAPCNPTNEVQIDPTREQGVVTCNADWAVVVMVTGANGHVRLIV